MPNAVKAPEMFYTVKTPENQNSRPDVSKIVVFLGLGVIRQGAGKKRRQSGTKDLEQPATKTKGSKRVPPADVTEQGRGVCRQSKRVRKKTTCH